MSERIHATAVALTGGGVLLFGPSGSGKSDLALRLVDRGARLISDDQTLVTRSGGGVKAAALPGWQGQIEVRGIGIVTLPFADTAEIALVAVLTPSPERLPRPSVYPLCGVDVPCIELDPRPSSAPLLIELALNRAPVVHSSE